MPFAKAYYYACGSERVTKNRCSFKWGLVCRTATVPQSRLYDLKMRYTAVIKTSSCTILQLKNLVKGNGYTLGGGNYQNWFVSFQKKEFLIYRNYPKFLDTLTFTILWAYSADDKLICFLVKIGFDISHELSPNGTMCMKCWSPFSGKK